MLNLVKNSFCFMIYIWFPFNSVFPCRLYEPVESDSPSSRHWSHRCFWWRHYKCRSCLQFRHRCIPSTCRWQLYVLDDRNSKASTWWPLASSSAEEKRKHHRLHILRFEPWLLPQKNRGHCGFPNIRGRSLCSGGRCSWNSFISRMLFSYTFFWVFNPIINL